MWYFIQSVVIQHNGDVSHEKNVVRLLKFGHICEILECLFVCLVGWIGIGTCLFLAAMFALKQILEVQDRSMNWLIRAVLRWPPDTRWLHR